MSTQTASCAVSARSLAKHYPGRLGLGRKPVLRGLDLELAAGSTLGLVGPNGSGKSTLQKILAGVERQSSGTLELFGLSPATRGVRARIGYVPEDTPFPGELSARAALDLIGSLHGMPRARVRERRELLLAKVGLAAHAREPLRRFSKGMQRRFALAQAWLHEPDLVLLDEPTAGLDAEGFDVLAELLQGARARGTSVVLSSHLVSDVHEHCDRVCVLMNGSFAARGAPSELFSRPDCWRIEAEHLHADKLVQLQSWIESNGGCVRAITPSGKSLFDLYREARAASAQAQSRS